MALIGSLRLNTIILFIIGSSQMTVRGRDRIWTTSAVPHFWQHFKPGGSESFHDDGDESEIPSGDGTQISDSSIIPAEPMEYSFEFASSRNTTTMSFGESVLRATLEAICLNNYGIQKNMTMGLPQGMLEERLMAPFGCFKSETFQQCKQCRGITSKLIFGSAECKSFCVKADAKCISACLKLKTWNQQSQSKFSGESTQEILYTPKEHHSSNPTSAEFYEESDSVNNSISNGDGKISAPLNYLQESIPMRKGISRVMLQTPQVFCEGVNYVDDDRFGKTPSISSSTPPSQVHFVLLKWNINESTSSKRFANTSSKYAISSSEDSERSEQTPLVFVIEQKSGNFSEWMTIGKTSFGLQMVNVAYHTNTYKWRITAVGPSGIEDVATTQEYVTLNGYQQPGPPKRIFVVKTEVRNYSVNVLIGWEPPPEKACFYKIVLEGSSGGKTETVRIKDQPLGVHMYWFEDLRFDTDYHVRMTSRNPGWKYESNLTKLDFKTPTCLEAYTYRFDKCAPPPPREIKAVTETTRREHYSSAGYYVQTNLSWLPPLHTSEENPIEKYLVEVSTFSLNLPISKVNGSKAYFPVRELTKNFTLSGNQTSVAVKKLKPDIIYTVTISAYSSHGKSPGAQTHFNTRIAVKRVFPHENAGSWVYVVVAFTIAAVMLLLGNAIRIYHHKWKVKIERNQYFQSMEERDGLSVGGWSIVPLTDDSPNWKLFDENFPKEKWEISWDHLKMAEVIGQGAFGIVRRAQIHRKKLERILKIREDGMVWFRGSDRVVDSDPNMETVAVKMEKVSPTRDNREQLIREITMMQSLGFHSQIVGLLGACTKGGTLCLVLEYCPGGDLLTFVRKVRAKYFPTLGLGSWTTPSCTRTIGGRGMKQMNVVENVSGDVSGSPSINYADIGGYSESFSSPEESLLGIKDNENFKMDFSRNSVRTENDDIPPFFSGGSHEAVDVDDGFQPIDERDVLSYARQIAMGMEYLEKNRVLHRDLACRNVLLMGDYKRVKISDFGLSRDIYTWNVYHQKSNGKLPLKWMSIESIFTHVFTSKSDVWSYGILLWELVTLGGTPYPGLGNTQLFHLLKSGYRMERPDNCSDELYAIMKKCWRTAAASRPSFTELRNHVEAMIEADEPNLYLSLMADNPVEHFQLHSRLEIPSVQVSEVISSSQDSPNEPPSHTTSKLERPTLKNHPCEKAKTLPGISSYNSKHYRHIKECTGNETSV